MPRLYGSRDVCSEADYENGIVQAKRLLTASIKVTKELDLPVSELGTVIRVVTQQIHGANEARHANEYAERQKLVDRFMVLRDEREQVPVSELRRISNAAMSVGGLGTLGADPLLDRMTITENMTAEELTAEIKRLEKLPAR